MGRFIQYSGSFLVLFVLLLVIYRAATEQGIISKKFIKHPKVARFLDLSLLVLIMQSAVMVVGFIICNAVHGKTNFFNLEKIWLRGDAKTMVDLATNMFSGGVNLQGTTTLYPLILNFAAVPFYKSYLLAGFTLSVLAVITACYYLYQLTTLDYDEPAARNAVKFMLFFPFSFCLFLPVPESFFLAFSIAAFYFLRKQKWFAAALWSFGAVVCDLRGVLLILPLIYEIFQQERKTWRAILPFGSIALGFIAILAFNQWQTGNFWAFLNHYATTFNFLNQVWNADIRVFYGNVLPLLVLITLIILGGFFALGRIRPSYLLYAVPLAAAAFFVPWMNNQPRFLATVFPLFIGLGLFIKNRTANLILLFLFAIIMGFYLFCSIFFNMSF